MLETSSKITPRRHPLDWSGCDAIEVIHGKLSGVPILKHSRVTVDAVLESYELGESVEDIAYSYSLDPEEIRKVLAFVEAGSPYGGRVKMSDQNLKTNLELYNFGTKWSPKYARRALPVLVRWVEEEKARLGGEPREFTYTLLAEAVGQPGKAHPIHAALGILGSALKELELQHKLIFGKIPPIQLIVWSKGKGSPGARGFGFVDLLKEQVEKLSPEARKSLARDIRNQTIQYPHWRQVLHYLDLKPLSLRLPEIGSVTASIDTDGFGHGESEEHKRFKRYLGEHYELLGLRGQFLPTYEDKLLSGDQTDLQLHELKGKIMVCVEVKSRISSDNDLIRGLFQCVKYKAILTAQETYNLARDDNYPAKIVRVILAIGREIDSEIFSLSRLLDVEVVHIAMRD